MQLAGRPVAAFDPEGLIFAAGINSESVKLYDLRSFDKGPFSSFKFSGKDHLDLRLAFRVKRHLKKGRIRYALVMSHLILLFLRPADKDVEWTGLKFSPDGKSILVSTNGSLIRLIDAFTGQTQRTFTGHLNSKGITLGASFSPGKFGSYTLFNIPLVSIVMASTKFMQTFYCSCYIYAEVFKPFPDSQFVISGSTDGRVHIWNAENGTKVRLLECL